MTAEKTVHLNVEGMSCTHCQMSVEKALKTLEGVQTAIVDLQAKTASVTFNAEKTNLEKIKEAVTVAGFEVTG